MQIDGINLNIDTNITNTTNTDITTSSSKEVNQEINSIAEPTQENIIETDSALSSKDNRLLELGFSANYMVSKLNDLVNLNLENNIAPTVSSQTNEDSNNLENDSLQQSNSLTGNNSYFINESGVIRTALASSVTNMPASSTGISRTGNDS